MAYEDFIKRLNDESWFKEFIENEIVPDVPRVPSHNPRDDNTDVWKYDSALREGYRLCLRKFGVRLNE